MPWRSLFYVGPNKNAVLVYKSFNSRGFGSMFSYAAFLCCWNLAKNCCDLIHWEKKKTCTHSYVIGTFIWVCKYEKEFQIVLFYIYQHFIFLLLINHAFSLNKWRTLRIIISCSVPNRSCCVITVAVLMAAIFIFCCDIKEISRRVVCNVFLASCILHYFYILSHVCTNAY